MAREDEKPCPLPGTDTQGTWLYQVWERGTLVVGLFFLVFHSVSCVCPNKSARFHFFELRIDEHLYDMPPQTGRRQFHNWL